MYIIAVKVIEEILTKCIYGLEVKVFPKSYKSKW